MMNQIHFYLAVILCSFFSLNGLSQTLTIEDKTEIAVALCEHPKLKKILSTTKYDNQLSRFVISNPAGGEQLIAGEHEGTDPRIRIWQKLSLYFYAVDVWLEIQSIEETKDGVEVKFIATNWRENFEEKKSGKAFITSNDDTPQVRKLILY